MLLWPSPIPTPSSRHLAAQRRDPARLRRHAPVRPAPAHRPALPALAHRAPARRLRPSRRGRARPQPPGPGPGRRPARRAHRTSARRLPPASSSARSATAAYPCPASPSTSAPRTIPHDAGRVLDPAIRRSPARRVRRRLDQARALRRDRHEQEGRPRDSRRDLRRPLRRHRGDSHAEPLRRTPTRPDMPDPTPSRPSCASASPTWSPTPAGNRSTATSAPSASPRDARASSSPASTSSCVSPPPNSRRLFALRPR